MPDIRLVSNAGFPIICRISNVGQISGIINQLGIRPNPTWKYAIFQQIIRVKYCLRLWVLTLYKCYRPYVPPSDFKHCFYGCCHPCFIVSCIIVYLNCSFSFALNYNAILVFKMCWSRRQVAGISESCIGREAGSQIQGMI